MRFLRADGPVDFPKACLINKFLFIVFLQFVAGSLPMHKKIRNKRPRGHLWDSVSRLRVEPGMWMKYLKTTFHFGLDGVPLAQAFLQFVGPSQKAVDQQVETLI